MRLPSQTAQPAAADTPPPYCRPGLSRELRSAAPLPRPSPHRPRGLTPRLAAPHLLPARAVQPTARAIVPAMRSAARIAAVSLVTVSGHTVEIVRNSPPEARAAAALPGSPCPPLLPPFLTRPAPPQPPGHRRRRAPGVRPVGPQARPALPLPRPRRPRADLLRLHLRRGPPRTHPDGRTPPLFVSPPPPLFSPPP